MRVKPRKHALPNFYLKLTPMAIREPWAMGAHVAHLTSSSNLFVRSPESDRLYNFMMIARQSDRTCSNLNTAFH